MHTNNRYYYYCSPPSTIVNFREWLQWRRRKMKYKTTTDTADTQKKLYMKCCHIICVGATHISHDTIHHLKSFVKIVYFLTGFRHFFVYFKHTHEK